MKEKKYLKISLGTGILLALIVILIVALVGMYFYYNPKKDEKNLETANIENLKNNTESNITESNISEVNSNVDKIAKELFENGSDKIRKLKYSDDLIGYEESYPRVYKNMNGKRYLKTDELYSNVENEYSKIFTEEALENVLNERFANIDGILYVSIGGATGWDITNLEVTRISESSDEIEYISKYKNVYINGISNEEESCKMTIKLVNGTYKISQIDYCDIDKI